MDIIFVISKKAQVGSGLEQTITIIQYQLKPKMYQNLPMSSYIRDASLKFEIHIKVLKLYILYAMSKDQTYQST